MLYFAYATNMDPEQLESRTSGHTVVGLASLLEYRLFFPLYSNEWGGGVAGMQAPPPSPRRGHPDHDPPRALRQPFPTARRADQTTSRRKPDSRDAYREYGAFITLPPGLPIETQRSREPTCIH